MTPRWIAAVFGGTFATACKVPCDDLPPPPADDGSTFELVDAWFTDTTHVELAFSRRLAPSDDVDPAKFRLSIARTDRYSSRSECLADTYYCELSLGFHSGGCAGCGYAYGSSTADEPDCDPPTVVTAIGAGGDDSRLRLEIEPPLRPIICAQADYVEDDGGIVLHFSHFDIPTIAAVDGTELRGFGERYVLDPDEPRVEGVFADRETLVRVRCPEGM